MLESSPLQMNITNIPIFQETPDICRQENLSALQHWAGASTEALTRGNTNTEIINLHIEMEADMVFILLSFTLQISSRLQTNLLPWQESVQDQRISPDI